MKPHAQEDLCPAQQQVLYHPDKKPTMFNALKHGLRSEAVLLPNDDAAQFHALRRDLFHLFRPANPAEARCVESMANLEWRIARCRRQQTVYDAHVDGLLFPDGAPAFHICERDEHDWSHKADDCTRQEVRLTRLLGKAQEALLLLQKLRRDRLIAGAVQAEPICWGEDTCDGEGRHGNESTGSTAAPDAPDAQPTSLSARVDRANGVLLSSPPAVSAGLERKGPAQREGEVRAERAAHAPSPATASDDGQSRKNDEQACGIPVRDVQHPPNSALPGLPGAPYPPGRFT